MQPNALPTERYSVKSSAVGFQHELVGIDHPPVARGAIRHRTQPNTALTDGEP